jgi:hypothetical protein
MVQGGVEDGDRVAGEVDPVAVDGRTDQAGAVAVSFDWLGVALLGRRDHGAGVRRVPAGWPGGQRPGAPRCSARGATPETGAERIRRASRSCFALINGYSGQAQLTGVPMDLPIRTAFS